MADGRAARARLAGAALQTTRSNGKNALVQHTERKRKAREDAFSGSKEDIHDQFWILFRRIQLLSQKTVILRAVTAIGSLLPVDLITADRDIDLHAQRTFVTACPPFQI